eukprot:CAMPEP_0197187358 /NCGR_PEP_ID=MMETSP1423-20130617/15745_1 /TAXON_ID=476441 /ORGANISM="Pseudo-nitzschia heimii, Strain UNC1101" /LENGTH=234 /DNA_ID=CAMNT_0042638915 /DNA_START=66 /DNA_END=767 /DNA_ORIENTATION=+
MVDDDDDDKPIADNDANAPMESSPDEAPVAAGDGSASEDAAAAVGDEDRSTAPTPTHDDDDEDETKSVSTATNPGGLDADGCVGGENDNDNDIIIEEEETKSVGTTSVAPDTETGLASPETARSSSVAEAPPPKKKRGKPQIPASARKGRAPAVKGLNIPFRTVKKAMKLDPDIPIVQNEAAIMTTLAAELFLRRLANQSQKICQKRGKNTIRYEDVADARANDPSLAFLKTVI